MSVNNFNLDYQIKADWSFRGVKTSRYNIDNTINADQQLIAPVAGKKIRVLAVDLQANTAVDIITYRTNNASGALLYEHQHAATQHVNMPFNPVGWFETVAGEALHFAGGATGDITGIIVYAEV